MPPAHDVKSRFRLGIDGAVELDLLEGSVAGGPLRGTVRLDRLDPPGTLTFDGKLAEAALGSLIDGLVGIFNAAELRAVPLSEAG